MGAPAVSIDRREYETLLTFAKTFALDAHVHLQAGIAALKNLDITHPRHADILTWQAIRDDLSLFLTYHEKQPYPVAPAGALDGRPIRTSLRQVADDQPITLTVEELARSGLLPGPTGEGKSTLALHLCRAVRAAGIHVIIIDPKQDDGLRALASEDPDFLILEPQTPINLIARDGALAQTEHEALLIDVGATTLFAGEDYKAIMTLAYRRAYEKHDEPTNDDVRAEIRNLQSKGETYKFRDAQRGADNRHARLSERYPGLQTRGGAPISILFEHSLYFPVTTLTEVEDFIITYLLRRLFYYHQRKER